MFPPHLPTGVTPTTVASTVVERLAADAVLGSAVPTQAGGFAVAVFLLVVVVAVVAVVGGVLWGVTALTDRLLGSSREAGREFQRGLTGEEGAAALTDHPAVGETERYGDGTPEVETTVDGRRVVARLETAPGGTDRFAVLQTPMLSVKPGTGFELARDGHGPAEFVDRGPDAPELPDRVWATLAELEAFGGLTVDDRTGVVEHRFPDPTAVTDPEAFRRQAEALVAVALAVEEHAEAARGRAAGGERESQQREQESEREREQKRESEREREHA